MSESPLGNVTTSVCMDLKIIDARPHHPCFSWNHTRIQCEIDWPCEVRQYLVSISPLINLSNVLLYHGTLIIIILGVLLNSLSLYTLISSGLLRSGSGVYLISLAICDLGNLLFNYLPGLLRAHWQPFNDLFMSSEWLCRWHGVFVEVFQLISAWIVVSFTVERCLAIWYPILLRSISRTQRAIKVVSTLSTILTLFSLTKLILTGFEKDSVFGYAACYSHRYRWQGVAYVRVAFQTWLPTVLVSIFNLLMFGKLRQLKRLRKRLTEIKRATATRQGSFVTRPSPTAPMLVAVSLAYLALVFPLGVVQTVELIWKVRNKQPVYTLGDWEGRERFIQWKNTKILLKYIRSLCFGFYQINFCINFFLYFAAGLQFRVHLQKKVSQLHRRWCGGGSNGGIEDRGCATPGTSSSALDSRRGSQRRPRAPPPSLVENGHANRFIEARKSVEIAEADEEEVDVDLIRRFEEEMMQVDGLIEEEAEEMEETDGEIALKELNPQTV